MKKREARQPLPCIGWREWVGLPDFGVEAVKAKIDTGARSSALHAVRIRTEMRDGEEWARFLIHPFQRHLDRTVEASAKILDHRSVRSSSGKSEMRWVVLTKVALMGKVWPIELTLTNRSEMGFRMLLGRQAFRGHFLVDVARSYLGGQPSKNGGRRP